MDFIRGPGFVLDFSDASFSEFFAAELDVDIDDPKYSTRGGSKGKRLRYFLETVDDKTVAKTVEALWEHRKDYLERTGSSDPVRKAEARFLALLSRMSGGGPIAGSAQEPPRTVFDRARVQQLRLDLIQLSSFEPHQRGYAFEAFLTSLFNTFGLRAREPFRNRGEQIDGSFILGGDTYLLEAKWQSSRIGAEELHTFQGKLDQKATWARGVFISYSGFTEDGLHAFGQGKSVICIDGLDLNDMFEREIPFDHVVDRKARRAVETGRTFVRVRDIFPL